MHAITYKLARLLLSLAVVLGGFALTGSPALAASVTINLCAVTGSVTLPGGVSVPVWGFADGGSGATPVCTSATPSLPGPVLSVTEGDSVTINVTNVLPAATSPLHTVSLEIPAVSFNAGGTPQAVVGATLTRTFIASAPGTYLYESGGDSGRQEAMGLYGALIVRPATANQAYDTPTSAYDVEATLVLSQIDPNFNAAPDTYDMYSYLATYWLINGQAYPSTTPITAASGQKVLLRYLNAGFDNTSMVLLGMHEHVLALDARLLNNPFDATAETIPAGATEDTIATVPSYAAPGAHGFPLYNRQLHVTNGGPANPSFSPGGMLTFIKKP